MPNSLDDQLAASSGPLYTAIASAIVPAALIIAILTVLKINMTTVLSVIIPAVTVTTLLLAFAMGWIFVLIGRLHRKPAKMPATFVIMGITMIELLVIIALAAEAGKSS